MERTEKPLTTSNAPTLLDIGVTFWSLESMRYDTERMSAVTLPRMMGFST